MNKFHIIESSISDLSIAISNHQQTPNEKLVFDALDRIDYALKPQFIKDKVIAILYYLY